MAIKWLWDISTPMIGVGSQHELGMHDIILYKVCLISFSVNNIPIIASDPKA